MTIHSVRKAVDILFAVAESERPLSLTEVSSKAGLPIATAKRLLDTLCETHMLKRDGKLYGLGLKAFEIGKKAERNMDLVKLSMPYLGRLRDETGESANLAVLDATDVVYVACAESSRMMRTFTVPGARVPAHCTGVGKVLLSGLPDDVIRERYRGVCLERFTAKTVVDVEALLEQVTRARISGYALDEGEREEGVVCVAAPIRDCSGCIVAAVSISGPAFRLTRKRIDAIKAKIKACCTEISSRLGWNGVAGGVGGAGLENESR
ncbi:MAG TPA: IclR family transcriptional regulator [Firmicutes bacterium]|nr:IclR family transcriptional regulator [Candidatus Fermentithermobacillaceae bacterium]